MSLLCTASNAARWERLHQEKAALEMAFERELQELQLQQEAELAAVEESIRKCHLAEAEHLKVEHRAEMEELRLQQQEQVRGDAWRDVAALCWKEGSTETTVCLCVSGGGTGSQPPGSHSGAQRHAQHHHGDAARGTRSHHERYQFKRHERKSHVTHGWKPAPTRPKFLCPDLRKAHEQQKALLEEDFEKLRLSLQVRPRLEDTRDQIRLPVFQIHVFVSFFIRIKWTR